MLISRQLPRRDLLLRSIQHVDRRLKVQLDALHHLALRYVVVLDPVVQVEHEGVQRQVNELELARSALVEAGDLREAEGVLDLEVRKVDARRRVTGRRGR